MPELWVLLARGQRRGKSAPSFILAFMTQRRRRGRMEFSERHSRAASAGYLVLAGPTQQEPEANVNIRYWTPKYN